MIDYFNALNDKVKHFVLGVIITAVVGFLAPAVWYGIVTGVLAGIAKEAYDRFDYGKADYFDMFATFGGAWVGGALVVLLT